MAELKIKADSGGGTVSFKGPATTTSNAAVQLTLPVDDGTANQYLKTDGSGALSWATVSSPVTALNNATANELVTVGSTTTELDAEANLTFDGTHLTIGGSGNLTYYGAQILEPAFCGYDVTNSSGVNGWKNIQWATMEVDTCSGWDNTNFKWVPDKEGWYLITFAHAHTGGHHDEYEAEIKVAGSVIASAACRADRISLSGVAYMNGTSDNCEWKIYHNNTNHGCDNGDKRTSGCAFRLSGVA